MSLTPPRLASGLAALTSAAAVAIAPPAGAASFSQIYSFGDSLVDTGNAFQLTQEVLGAGVPPAPYVGGRFSNGPLWNEYLAEELGVPQTSLGYGGALSSTEGLLLFGGGPILPVPGLLSQIDTFIGEADTVDPNALYILWAGANDYLFANVTDPSGPVGNLTSAVTTLSAAGARNFLLPNLPDLGDLPLLGLIGAAPETVAGLNALSGFHNQALALAVNNLDQQATVSADLLDANSLFKAALAGELGFDNTVAACTLTPSCVGNPAVQDSFLFWDQVHITTRAYQIVADAAFEQLDHQPAATVPEPGVVLGLSLAGLAVAGYGRQRSS